jgi:hypothetical protein
MKKIIFILALAFAIFSCSKSESTPTPAAPTNKLVGTWVLTSSLKYVGTDPVPVNVFANNPCDYATEITFAVTTSTSGTWSYKAYTYDDVANNCTVDPLSTGTWVDDNAGSITYKQSGQSDTIGKNVFSNSDLTRTETTTTFEGGTTRIYVETFNKK